MRLIALFAAVFLCAGCRAAGEAPAPRDFAFGLPIKMTTQGAIFEAPLPLEFYRGLAGAGTDDLCAFNGHGEVIPYAIRQASLEVEAPPALTPLPLFPIPGGPGRRIEDIAVKIWRDAAGAVIRLDTSEQVGREADTAAYLLDATSLKKPIKALEFQWAPTADGFVGSITFQGSEDLERWSVLSRGSVLASLQYGEHELVQKRIVLQETRAKYLRILWPPALQRVKLTGVSAEPARETPEPSRQWAPAAVVKQGGPGEYLFEAPGPLPVDRIRVKLPQKNTLATAEFFSRDDVKSPWRRRSSGLIYQLHLEGGELVNSDLMLQPAPFRFWMLRVRESGGGLGHGLPEIELGWITQHLVFVARGEGPFLLAYGNAQRRFANTRVDDLLTGLSDAHQRTVSPQPAEFAAQIVLGGEDRLKSPVMVDRTKYLLWAALILAVGVLAWMSLRLYRQMSARDTERGSE